MSDGTELSVIIHRVSFLINPNTLKISDIRGTDTAGLEENMPLTSALACLTQWTTGLAYPEYEREAVYATGEPIKLIYTRREFERQEVVRRKEES